jgi:N-acetylglucosaminyldiphosphoundecaprenol N-acetyl-beta-D-mannosaminyltransferase
MMKSYPSINLFDVNISTINLAELFSEIKGAISMDQRLLIGNVNTYAMNLAWKNSEFINILGKFDILFCDGFGVKVGASLSGQHIPERFTPPDFINQLMELVRDLGGSVFLLGAKPGTTEKAAQTLENRIPGIKIAGTFHGFFDKTPDCPENESVIAAVNSSNPSLLLVGFGMPLQEEWITANWQNLNVPIAIMVGALFDTLSGNLPRGPRFLTDHGFEWLARLIIEPRRLWKRYIIGNPLFFLRVVKQRLTGKTKFE